MWRALVLALVFACCAIAQKVELTNHTDKPLVGWFQCNIDILPPFPAGSLLDEFGSGKCNFAVGNRSGLDTYNIDVYTVVQAREHLVLDLATVTAGGPPNQLPPPPTNDYLGGVTVKVAGVRMTQQSAAQNGAAYDFAYMARVGPMLVVHLFLHWYPDQKGWCRGEVVVTASNPSVQDVVAFIPAGFKLQVGDAIVNVPGLGPNPDLLPEGDWLADAQRRAMPITLTWPDHFGEHDAHTAQAWADLKVGIRGISKLHAAGNPPLPPGFDGAKWATDLLPDVVAKLLDWTNSGLDPAVDSGATGAQGSQPPSCAAPMMAYPLAVTPLYLTMLAASWPMFHLEQDGSTLNWKGHQGLRMNRGRVNRPISTDDLGKRNEPTAIERHAHTGPEWEHWFHFNAFAGVRATGTPAGQLFLEAHAVNFLFNFNVEEPGNWLPPSRGVGFMCFLAVELYRGLQNRELAEAVATRWRALFHRLIVPKMSGDKFYSWLEDPRIGWTPGTPERAIPWQAAVYLAGLNWAAFTFGVEEAWLLAAHSSHDFIERVYVNQGGRWIARDVICRDRSDPGPYIGAYGYFGNPLGVAVMKLHNPGHAIAAPIWEQLMQTTNLGDLAWMIPLGMP